MFSPFNASSVSVNAVELITEAILSGKIKPGQRLNETHLAAEFRVSRTPIREALQQPWPASRNSRLRAGWIRARIASA